MNHSAFDLLTHELNRYADLRERLVSFTSQLGITTSNTIQIQATTLAQLTQSTNQLTRTTLVPSSHLFLITPCNLS